jgi:glucose/arabinose dehydrogenase/mono/diheme cytochrome c family protein
MTHVAQLLAAALGGSTAPHVAPTGLQAAIAEKNNIWFNCWRPANWPFAYGDRATQAFGKSSGVGPDLRELYARHGALLSSAEAKIAALLPTPPSAADTAQGELAALEVRDGFTIKLFADESLGVVKPTQIAWDEFGRLYVACSPTYPQPLPGVNPGDYILRLEDRDGDGVADHATRFAEGLTMVLGIEPCKGGVYVCDFDRLIRLEDTNGDGRADVRTVILSGFGIGDTHQLINSICRGPDGALWFSQGLHTNSRVETPWGVTVLEKAGLWRYNLSTQRLDAFFNGAAAGVNCFGVAFDDYGQVFHKSGDRPHGYYSTPGLGQFSQPEDYHSTGALFASKSKTTSLEIIGTPNLPAEFQGSAVIAGFLSSVVELHQIREDGAGFQSRQMEPLIKSSSGKFRPVDVSVGPDGAIYIADWYNKVIGHYQNSYADPDRDRKNGRIWRVSAVGAKPAAVVNLAAMKPEALLDQLRAPDRWTRYQAKRLLFEYEQPLVVAAADRWWSGLDVQDPNYARLLIDVAGVYQAHDVVNARLVSTMLTCHDARARAYGCRLVAGWSTRLPGSFSNLKAALLDPHPRVRLEAIVALSWFPEPNAVNALIPALRLPRDRFLEYALTQTMRSLQSFWQPLLASGKLPLEGDAGLEEMFSRVALGRRLVPPPGASIYKSLCLNCHQQDGRGLPGIYPSLTSQRVTGDKTRLIKIVLHGLAGPISMAGVTFASNGVVMPPQPLDDQQIADVLTYVRSAFGNKFGDAVSLTQVQKVRAENSGRTTPWTEAELLLEKPL